MGRLIDWLTAAAPAPDMPSPAEPIRGLSSPWQDDSILRAVTLEGLWPETGDGPITREMVNGIPAVTRIRDLIVVSASRCPLVIKNAAGVISPEPAFAQQPEAGRARSVTIQWTIDNLFYYGRSSWLIVDRYAASNGGGPKFVRWVPEWSAQYSADGQLTHAFGRPVGDPRNVIRFDGPHEGIVNRSASTWRRIRRINRSIDRQVNNPVASVELHQTDGPPLTDPEIDKLIAGWAAARQGENGGVAFTNQYIEAKDHGIADGQFLGPVSARMDLEAARACGAPAWAADAETGGGSLTYSNVPSRARELIDYTLSGYLGAISTRLSLDDVFPHGTWADFDTDPLTDGDFAERMAAYKAAQDAGIYTAEQMQSRELGIPLEETDTQA